MKKFLTRSLVFFSLIVALLLIGEWVIRMSPNMYKTKNEAVKKYGTHTETLILGNSHNYFGLRPDLMPWPSLNLANVSQTLEIDCKLLEHYDDQLPSLQRVILTVSVTTFFTRPLEDNTDWFRIRDYQLYMGMRLHSPLSRYGWEIANIKVYNRKLKNILSGEKAWEADSLGHGLAYDFASREINWENTGPANARNHLDYMYSDRRTPNIAHMDSILNLCERKGLKVYMVSTPEWSSYRDVVGPYHAAEMRHIADSIAQSRTSVTYLNYYSDPRFGADDFFDADHINSDRGAAKLTRIVVRDMEECEAVAHGKDHRL